MPKISAYQRYANFMEKNQLTQMEWSFSSSAEAEKFKKSGLQWVRTKGCPYCFRKFKTTVTMYPKSADPGPNRYHFDQALAAGNGTAKYTFDNEKDLVSCRISAYHWRKKRNNGAIIRRIGLKSITVTLPAPS